MGSSVRIREVVSRDKNACNNSRASVANGHYAVGNSRHVVNESRSQSLTVTHCSRDRGFYLPKW